MKKILSSVLCLTLLLTNIQSVQAIELESTYAVALDVDTGLVLYDKNANEKMYPASMTKVLTTYVALQHIDDLDATVTITSKDLEGLFEAEASVAYYAVGEVTTYRDLLYAVMLPSGADACQALAYRLFGSIEEFVVQMNKVVSDLGLTNTNFANPTGLDDLNHYTTAYEMAQIIAYVCQDEQLLEIFGTDSYRRSDGMYNWLSSGYYLSYRLDIDTSRILGCKTGFTDLAQLCLASYNETLDRNIVVVTGDYHEDLEDGFTQETNDVLDYVEDHYSLTSVFAKDEIIDTINVKNVLSNSTFDIKAYTDFEVLLPIDYSMDDITVTYSFDELVAPIKKGASVGTYSVNYKNNELYTSEIISSDNYNENIILKLLFGSKPLYYTAFVLLIISVIRMLRKRKA